VSKIEIGRWSNQLRRMLGQKGVVDVAADLSPEISPTFCLEEPSAEWDFLKMVRGCACTDTLGAAAGFTGRWRLRNPVGSGVLVVIDQVALSGSVNAVFEIARGQIFGDHAAGRVTVVPDLRWGAVGATTTTMLFSGDNGSAAGVAGDRIVRTRVLAETTFVYRNKVVLIPGTSLDFGSATQNIAMATWVVWRERNLPALESDA